MIWTTPVSCPHTRCIRFNDTCSYIVQIAYEQCCVSNFQLQRLLYYEVCNRFGMSAQLAICAIAKVVEAYKHDQHTPWVCCPTGAVVYDECMFSFQGLDAVSLVTLQDREVIPMQMGEY
jgi:putative transposase